MKSLNLKILSAIARFPKRDFASSTPPTRSPTKSRWPIFALGFSSGLAASLAVIAYNENKSDQVLNPTNFTPFILVGKDRISSTSSVFTLQPILTAKNSQVYIDAWKKGVWSLQVKQPQLQIARAYTPLPPLDGEGIISRNALKFLIREEPRGEVSGYLHRLPLGATVDLRGPHLEFEIPKDIDEVLFIAGGTGIAPALQVAHSLTQVGSETARIRILWANRKREDSLGGTSDPFQIQQEYSWIKSKSVPRYLSAPASIEQPINSSPQETALVKQLNALKAKRPLKISIEYFVDEEDSFITESLLKARLNDLRLEDYYHLQPYTGREGPELVLDSERRPGRKLVLISGPDGFVKHHAGPKVWKEGQETQGALGGVLKNINPKGWEVWKL